MSDAFARLRCRLGEAATLASASSVLAWDQETYLPPRGAAARAEQLALLAGLVHERRTAPEIGDLLAACETDPALAQDPVAGANLREIRRDFDRGTRLPGALVRALAETCSLALAAWRDARERSDFAAFAPWLDRILELARQKAACLAPHGDPYDALLDEYEPGATAASVEQTFASLRPHLVELVAVAASASKEPASLDGLRVPVDRQQEFAGWLVEHLGFELQAGRLDESAHPFCDGIASGDTRLTVRYHEHGFLDALGSVLHEAGHGLYEQGLPKAGHWGLPVSEAASLGIHESQSRLWENMVGRSPEFCGWVVPASRSVLGGALADVGPGQLFRALNRVQPGPIRTEADEVTYNLHILLRFDVERALLAGGLRTADLPGEWNGRMRTDLRVNVADDARGCLQDIHWSMGAIGYFPTYTLGNIYAAQFWLAAQRELPELDVEIGRGDFRPLLEWLRERIHRHGRRWNASDLCVRVSGAAPDPAALREYLRDKVERVSRA